MWIVDKLLKRNNYKTYCYIKDNGIYQYSSFYDKEHSEIVYFVEKFDKISLKWSMYYEYDHDSNKNNLVYSTDENFIKTFVKSKNISYITKEEIEELKVILLSKC